MNSKKIIVNIFKVGLLLGIHLWDIGVNAQDIRELTLSAASEAQEMVEDNQREQAIRHLELAITKLGSAQSEARYRSYLYFNQGYIYEQWPTANNKNYLNQAQRLYQLSLRERPGYEKALNNLILVSRELEDYDTALKSIEMIKKSDSSLTGKWDLLAGDIYREQSNVQQSWRRYTKAVDKDQNNREAFLKLIDLYQEMPPSDGNKLIALCKKFKTSGRPEMARLGFGEILSIHCSSGSAYLEEALLGWCGVVAANDRVRPLLINDIDRLKCDLPALLQIKSNITETWQIKPENSWWSQNDRRKFYYLAMQKNWADYLLSIGKKKEALKLYIDTRDNARNIRDFSREIYGRNNVLEMESLVQLARLYADKSLNPDGRSFQRLERELFAGKGGAYRRGDLPEIQKFHTILALIYVEREQWEGEYARNAVFQLEHAISIAERRSKKNPKAYKPMPHLHRYLVTAYQKTNRLEKAADASLNAAIGYLETDNLELSQQMILESDALKPHVQKQDVLDKQEGVKAIYKARTQVRDLDAGSFEVGNNKYYRGTSTYNWLDNPNLIKEIDPKIVERQRFKIVTDLSMRAKKVGAVNASGNLKKEAKTNAGKVQILSSQQDVIRLKQIDVSNNLINYKSSSDKDRQIRQDLRTGDKILLPEQNNQMQRVIITKDKAN